MKYAEICPLQRNQVKRAQSGTGSLALKSTAFVPGIWDMSGRVQRTWCMTGRIHRVHRGCLLLQGQEALMLLSRVITGLLSSSTLG